MIEDIRRTISAIHILHSDNPTGKAIAYLQLLIRILEQNDNVCITKPIEIPTE